MIPRTALIQLGKLVAQDLASGTANDSLTTVGEALASDRKAMLTLLDLVAKEGAKKKPDDQLLSAYGLLFGQGLEVLRYGIERAHPEAVASVAAVTTQVRELATAGKVDSGILLLLLQQFVSARLDLDPELQALMGDMMEQAPPSTMSPGAIDGFLADLVRHFDGDAFAIHGQLAEQAAAVPETHRAGMAMALLGAPEPVLREAAIGWMLESSATTRRDIVGLIEQAAARRLVSGTMLRRMITMRNWLPEAERPALDAVVKACRLKGVELIALSAAKIVEVVASGIDGAGAQSLFVLVKEGRKHAVASLLVKQGVGVRDAWVSHGMTKAQAEGMLDHIGFQMQQFDTSIDYLHQALGDALSVNAQSGELPPFGLVDFLETLGLATANPEPLPGDELLARLVDAIPGRMRGPASVKRALKASARWPAEYGFLESWFEDGGDLDGLLGAKKLSPQQRHALVLDQYLPSRRVAWAQRLCWTAEMFRHDPEQNADWLDFALVAREVAGDRPLVEIPVMVMVAGITVEAWMAR